MTDLYAEATSQPPRPDLASRGRRSRSKGQAWEREVARRLREAGIPASRGLSQTRGAEVPDVDAPGLWVEAKCGRQPNPRAALRQAARDNASAGGGRLEVVAIHDDQDRPGSGAHEWVAMPWNDWLEMCADAHRWRTR